MNVVNAEATKAIVTHIKESESPYVFRDVGLRLKDASGAGITINLEAVNQAANKIIAAQKAKAIPDDRDLETLIDGARDAGIPIQE